jgi:CRP/FNR family cyclic AMP-dependent transcriptional regulator
MIQHTLEPILAEHPFFRGLEKHYLELLVGCASNLRFEAGEFLFREGEEANRFYLLRSGRVHQEIATSRRGPLVIQTLGEGDILGWSWLLPPYRWSLDARAVELTRAVALDGACLRGKCEEDHDLGYELHRRFASVIAQQLKVVQFQLVDMYDSGL